MFGKVSLVAKFIELTVCLATGFAPKNARVPAPSLMDIVVELPPYIFVIYAFVVIAVVLPILVVFIVVNQPFVNRVVLEPIDEVPDVFIVVTCKVVKYPFVTREVVLPNVVTKQFVK